LEATGENEEAVKKRIYKEIRTKRIHKTERVKGDLLLILINLIFLSATFEVFIFIENRQVF